MARRLVLLNAGDYVYSLVYYINYMHCNVIKNVIACILRGKLLELTHSCRVTVVRTQWRVL